MANITKTPNVEILTHALVTHPGITTGAAQNVNTHLAATIYMYHAAVEAAANTNPGTFDVQTNPTASGDEHWITHSSFTASTGTPATETISGAEAAASTVIEVASTTGFTAGNLIYIEDVGTLADSEWAEINRIVTDTSVDLVDGLTNAKDGSDVIWGNADRFVTMLDLTGIERLRVKFRHRGTTGANVHVKALIVTGDSIG